MAGAADDVKTGGDGDDGLVPSPVSPPKRTPLPPDVASSDLRVFFDLETTGFGAKCHITQIAAIGPNGSFDRYVLPKVPVQPKAAKVTGITVRKDQLYHKSVPVDSLSVTQALEEFVAFLGEDPVLLTGHNVCRFDAPILVRTAIQCGMLEKLRKAVLGFLDTFEMFKRAYPGLDSYKQVELYRHFIGGDYDAHNALGDVTALQELYGTGSPADVAPYTFDMAYTQDVVAYRRQGKDNLQTWRHLFVGPHVYITKAMATRAASSGLTLQHIEEAFKRGGKEAVEEVFSEPAEGGKARVTKCSRVINQVVEFLQTT